ncbi:MAG: hypothetical protein ACOC96_00625 [Actinomycetota bacterium]
MMWLAAETEAEPLVSAEMWGGGALLAFLLLLGITLAFGKGRPHT